MTTLTASISYLTDMDDVLIREGEMIPGAEVDRHPYLPPHVVDDIGDVADVLLDPFGDGHYQG